MEEEQEQGDAVGAMSQRQAQEAGLRGVSRSKRVLALWFETVGVEVGHMGREHMPLGPRAAEGRGGANLVPRRRVRRPMNTERMSLPKEAALTGSSFCSWQCSR